VQTRTDNDTPAEDLREIFVAIFVAEFLEAMDKREITMQNVEKYMQKNIGEAL
jgi:hypothetical protein